MRPRWTGERTSVGAEFDSPTAARHISCYQFAARYAAGKSVLDVGCGEGHGVNTLARVAGCVVGIDLARDVIRRAAQDTPADHVRHLVMDAQRLAFGGSKFDLAVSIQNIEHLPDAEGFLGEVTRVLKPGGRFVVCTPNARRSYAENPYHVHEFVLEELRDLLTPHFRSAEPYGVVPSERASRWYERHARQVRRLYSLDFLRLRQLLPRPALLYIYGTLSRLTKQRSLRDVRSQAQTITAEDFAVVPGEFAEAVDLCFVCKAD